MVDTFGREDVLVNNVNLKGLFFMSHGRWWLDSVVIFERMWMCLIEFGKHVGVSLLMRHRSG